MPVVRKTAHRIRAGTYAVGSITSTYAISGIATQSDQGAVEWVLDLKQSTAPRLARIVQRLDRSRVGDGRYAFTWVFNIMTLGMYDYWIDTFLPGGVYSAAVSVMTYDESDTAVYLNCTLAYPERSTPIVGGYADVRWNFEEGTIIT